MTFLELINQEHPDIVSESTNKETGAIEYLFGCPRRYDYESTWKCPFRVDGNRMSCKECWNREIHEIKAEEPIDLNINLKEEKKMMNLDPVIRDAVLNAISDSDIEDAVKDVFANHDYSDMIQRAVENYLYDNLEDIAEDIVDDAVRGYMEENL